MPERQRGRAVPPREPPQEPGKEHEPGELYYKAARYPGEVSAGAVYDQAQELIYRVPCDLSAFRIIVEQRWHVALLGSRPEPELDQQIDALLSTGEPATLPSDILTYLQKRRGQATQIGPWVEGHYRPGKRVKRRKK